MAIAEDRLQVLVPRRLKRRLEEAARRRSVSVGAFVRQVIEQELGRTDDRKRIEFPFGEDPIHTGRRHGSTEHDRP